MSSDPPEYHTKTLSPLSPLPVHPPEPANIPVLRNQIDPIFNMTSTHIDTEVSPELPSQNGAPAQAEASSPSSDSSFTDAYQDQSGIDGNKAVDAAQTVAAVDDYAMTFDSDGEEQGQVQDVSQAAADSTKDPLNAHVSASTISSSDIAHDPSNTTQQNGPNSTSVQVPSISADRTAEQPLISPFAQRPQTPPSNKEQAPSYDDAATGGVDIQQLLDNITANAEKTEPTTQSTGVPAPTPALPVHSSLPPRPQASLPQPIEELRTYPANTTFPPAASSYRPPGIAPILVAAGAPGTSTDPRSGLPPPPPPGTTYSEIITPSGHEQMSISIDHRDDTDNPEKRWGPEVQKLYDIFLEEERKNVTEGTWEKFPSGSRLFVGRKTINHKLLSTILTMFREFGKRAGHET